VARRSPGGAGFSRAQDPGADETRSHGHGGAVVRLGSLDRSDAAGLNRRRRPASAGRCSGGLLSARRGTGLQDGEIALGHHPPLLEHAGEAPARITVAGASYADVDRHAAVIGRNEQASDMLPAADRP